ncbi:MAG: hypothetical protein II298_08365 [Bacteroidales bacterium]|nr:hypothetical protein [Bacteroidales bacterium]
MEKQNQTEQSSKKHAENKIVIIMWSIFIILILFIVALCNRIEPPTNKHYVEIDTLTGTVTVEQKDVDKILEEEKAKRDSIISKLENSFTKKYDEFEERYWIKPKTAPKYTDMNGCYCYFQIQHTIASNFRFVFQYFAADWLFIDRMIFNIDGENTTIIPDMNTDHANGNIWEWCDVSVDKYSSTNESFILKLANAKSVKVKLIGSNSYYKIKTLSEQQIKSIKETYNYYKALGGEF